MMRVVRHLEPGRRPFRSPVVALGNFDGLHLGHQAIMRRTIELASQLGGEPVAFTFWPHPIKVLAPHRAPEMITSLAARIAALRDTGMSGAVVRHFTRKFASLSPEEFVRDVLVGRLGVAGVVVGYNVTFGRDRMGTPEVLRDLARGYGFAVDVDTLPKNAKETHRSLFDGSNCGIALDDRPAFSVQHHPEASPGPQDSHYLFHRFVEMMDRAKG